MTKIAIFVLSTAMFSASAFAERLPSKPVVDNAMPPGVEASAPSKLDPADVAVLKTLHQDNINEIEMGKMAQEQGTLASTKSFGKKLVADHTSADKKILAFCKRMKVDAAELGDPVPDHNHPELAGKAEADWDRAFATMMVGDHQKAIDLVETSRKQTANPKVAALLSQILPTLIKHQGIAKKISMQGSKV